MILGSYAVGVEECEEYSQQVSLGYVRNSTPLSWLSQLVSIFQFDFNRLYSKSSPRLG